MAALVVGMIYGARKDARQTESFATAVAAMRRAGPPRGLAMVFHQMGVSYLESHQYEAAYDALAESLRIYRNDNAVPYLPDVQEDLGRLQLSALRHGRCGCAVQRGARGCHRVRSLGP